MGLVEGETEMVEDTYTEAKVRELLPFVTRDARRFLTDFDTSPEYESDVDRFITCHHSWVTSEADLNNFGKAVRAYLLANPELVEAA
jgi:hypothetical protein